MQIGPQDQAAKLCQSLQHLCGRMPIKIISARRDHSDLRFRYDQQFPACGILGAMMANDQHFQLGQRNMLHQLPFTPGAEITGYQYITIFSLKQDTKSKFELGSKYAWRVAS